MKKERQKGKKTSMKKGHFFALIMVLALVLSACGGGASQEASQPADAPATTDDTADTQGEDEGESTESEPTESESQGEPAEGESQGEPAEGESQGEPAEGESQGEPAEGESQGDPAEGDTNASGPLHTKHLQFGVVPHLYYTDHERVLQLTKNAGFDWIRQQIVWRDTEGPNPGEYVWDDLDTIVEATNTYDLKLLISIVKSPPFYNEDGGLPEDPTSLGDFVQALLERYGDKIHAYEIWNEQNLAHETGGTIVPEDVGHYVEILMECYTRIKSINPDAYVLAGAPSSTGFTRPDVALSDLEYYKAMYTYKDGIIKDYFDVQAVHPGGSANPPDTLWPYNPSNAEGWTDDSTFYFRHIENVHKVMEEHGLGDYEMWITEYGWATENTTPGYKFGNQISMEQQAEYITGAVEYTYENYPWIGNMFLWNMNFAVTWREHLERLQQKEDLTAEEAEWLELYWNDENPAQPLHEQASFGILSGDWSPRPSYLALQSLMAQIKAEQAR